MKYFSDSGEFARPGRRDADGIDVLRHELAAPIIGRRDAGRMLAEDDLLLQEVRERRERVIIFLQLLPVIIDVIALPAEPEQADLVLFGIAPAAEVFDDRPFPPSGPVRRTVPAAPFCGTTRSIENRHICRWGLLSRTYAAAFQPCHLFPADRKAFYCGRWRCKGSGARPRIPSIAASPAGLLTDIRVLTLCPETGQAFS